MYIYIYKIYIYCDESAASPLILIITPSFNAALHQVPGRPVPSSAVGQEVDEAAGEATAPCAPDIYISGLERCALHAHLECVFHCKILSIKSW